MTKNEAIEAMVSGKKVKHSTFLDDEFIKHKSNDKYEYEDGVTTKSINFWNCRKGEIWEHNWVIVE